MKEEEWLQRSISDFLKLKYPNILFNLDMSGVKLPMGLAVKVKNLRNGKSYPDMMIYEKRHGYCALFMELKKESPYLKDGKTLKKKILYKNVGGVRIPYDHLKEQKNMLEKLNQRGYFAVFVWDIDAAKKLIDWYLVGDDTVKLLPNI